MFLYGKVLGLRVLAESGVLVDPGVLREIGALTGVGVFVDMLGVLLMGGLLALLKAMEGFRIGRGVAGPVFAVSEDSDRGGDGGVEFAVTMPVLRRVGVDDAVVGDESEVAVSEAGER